jgi:hypothetical protein
MRRIVTLVLVAAALAATAAVAFASQSAKAVSASIVAAARTQHSVHWSATEVIGAVALKTGTDAAKNEGVQQVTFVVGPKKAHVRIIVKGGVAYIRGDALGLRLNLPLTKAQSKKYAGKWISIPKLDPAYKSIAEGDTMASVIQGLAPKGKLSVVSGKLHKTRVIGVRGVSGSGSKRKVEVILAPKKGKRLPLEQDTLVASRNAIGHTTFSKWNETVKVTAPSRSTPIAAVRAG